MLSLTAPWIVIAGACFGYWYVAAFEFYRAVGERARLVNPLYARGYWRRYETLFEHPDHAPYLLYLTYLIRILAGWTIFAWGGALVYILLSVPHLIGTHYPSVGMFAAPPSPNDIIQRIEAQAPVPGKPIWIWASLSFGVSFVIYHRTFRYLDKEDLNVGTGFKAKVALILAWLGRIARSACEFADAHFITYRKRVGLLTERQAGRLIERFGPIAVNEWLADQSALERHAPKVKVQEVLAQQLSRPGHGYRRTLQELGKFFDLKVRQLPGDRGRRGSYRFKAAGKLFGNVQSPSPLEGALLSVRDVALDGSIGFQPYRLTAPGGTTPTIDQQIVVDVLFGHGKQAVLKRFEFVIRRSHHVPSAGTIELAAKLETSTVPQRFRDLVFHVELLEKIDGRQPEGGGDPGFDVFAWPIP